jgi:hypothetical protein
MQALGNVAGTAADVLGAGTYGNAAKEAETGILLSKTAPSLITKTADAASAAKALITSTPEQLAAKQAAKIVDTVSPKLTAAETSDAIAARGGSKTGLLRTITANPDPAVQRIAQTVQKYVPDFNPAKSLVENINATKATVGTLASDLKQAVVASGKDRIYSFKQLGASLNGLEKPTLLVGDSEKVYKNVISKAMEIARSNGGKVSDLFQARKEFDQFVSKQIPNLYNSDTQTAMRIAIRNVRNALTDFTAEHLPPDIGLHDALTVQSHLLDAIENMSGKAASGAQKEVGTNAIERATSAIKNHPVLSAAGGFAALQAAKKLPVIGGLLP